MKTILIWVAGLMLGNSVSAQTLKTEPQKKIDSERALQIEEQRGGPVTTQPVTNGSVQTGAQSQSNAIETRNTGTNVVDPTPQSSNLPLQQNSQGRGTVKTTTITSSQTVVNPGATSSRRSNGVMRKRVRSIVTGSRNDANNTIIKSDSSKRKSGTKKSQ